MSDILKKINHHLKQPVRPLYRSDKRQLTPIKRRPFGTITALIFILGVYFFLLFLMWSRERYNMTQLEPITMGLKSITAVDGNKVDDSQIGKPIYFSGKLSVEAPPEDPHFKLKTKSLALRRVVEMYQRNQTGDIEDGNESYENQWLEKKIDPSKFSEPWFSKYEVTNSFFEDMQSETFLGKLKLGQFSVSKDQVEHLIHFKNADLDLRYFAILPEDLAKNTKLYNDKFYLAEKPKEPQPGDVRFYFQVADPVDVTVMATMSEESALSPLSEGLVDFKSTDAPTFFNFSLIPQPPEEVSGKIQNTSNALDPLFSLTSDSVSLKRIIDVYQEEPNLPADKDGGVPGKWTMLTAGKTVSDIDIVPAELRSLPEMKKMTSATFYGNLRLGDYLPAPKDVAKHLRYKPSEVDLKHLIKLPDSLQGHMSLHRNAYYSGSPDGPEHGDIRIRFETAQPQIITIRGTFPHVTGDEKKTSILNVRETFREGVYPLKDSIERLQSLDHKRIWMERVLSFILLTLFTVFFTTLCRLLGDWDIRFLILHYALYHGKGLFLSFVLGTTAMASAWAAIPPSAALGVTAFTALGFLWFWILTVREGQPYEQRRN